jgi:NADPH:quinone reductase-like Zn-dependent oxidoreductase
MRAIVQDTYGAAEALHLEDIDRPAPAEGEVLVRVGAASLFVGDWHIMTGLPFVFRLVNGFNKPKVRVRGQDVAGTVDAIGTGVTRFAPGDEIFGTCNGSFAEYATARQDKIAPKPTNLTFEEAAAVPITGTTALQAVRHGGVRAGQTVLVIGAAGGVGSYIVQIAKAYGASVTGVCSTEQVELVGSIGADDVIDYTRQDFAEMGRRWDVILETAGRHPVPQLRRALAPEGTLVFVGSEGGGKWTGGFGRPLRAQLLAPFTKQTMRSFVSKENAEDLLVLKELIEAGKVAPVIGATFPLEKVPDAVQHMEQGHARGKIVITI